MNNEKFDKFWEYLKIQDKIDKLIDKREQKLEEIKKLNEAINSLKDAQKKYE